MLFAIDQLLKGVVRAISGLAILLPIPGVSNIIGVVRFFPTVAIGPIDEVILAYTFRIRADNPWEANRDGLGHIPINGIALAEAL